MCIKLTGRLQLALERLRAAERTQDRTVHPESRLEILKLELADAFVEQLAYQIAERQARMSDLRPQVVPVKVVQLRRAPRRRTGTT